MNNFYKKVVAATVSLGVLFIGQIATARIYNPPSSSGSQTPWTTNIDGGGYALSNVLNAIFTNATTTNATSTNSVITNLTATRGTITNATTSGFSITGLGTAAGTFIAVDASGNVIATTSPAGGSQTPWTADIDGATYNLLNTGKIGIGTSTPYSALDIWGDGAETGGISLGAGSEGDTFYLWNGSGTFNIVGAVLKEAGISTMFYMEDSTTGDFNLGTDAAWTGAMALGSGSTVITLDGYASTTALTGDLFDTNNHRVYTRWSDGFNATEPTTTDTGKYTQGWGNCLEPSGNAVTLDKVSAIIASTTSRVATDKEGISWNINYGPNFYDITGTLFTNPINTYSTTSQTSYTPDVTTLPAGNCWWPSFTTASTSQIGSMNVNIYGYEN